MQCSSVILRMVTGQVTFRCSYVCLVWDTACKCLHRHKAGFAIWGALTWHKSREKIMLGAASNTQKGHLGRCLCVPVCVCVSKRESRMASKTSVLHLLYSLLILHSVLSCHPKSYDGMSQLSSTLLSCTPPPLILPHFLPAESYFIFYSSKTSRTECIFSIYIKHLHLHLVI